MKKIMVSKKPYCGKANTSWVRVQMENMEEIYGIYTSTDKIGRAFDSGKLYEQPLLEWIYQQEYRLALDVGANIGNHTLWMAVVCECTVVAFEPVIPNVVQANVDLNQRYSHMVEVYPMGLGKESGTFHHVGKGVLKPGKSANSTDEVVRIVRLDDLNIKRKIDFIKVDVEGLELDVLEGGMKTIGLHKPDFAIEEWASETTIGIKRLLEPLGYVRTLQFGGKGRAPMGIWQARGDRDA